MRGEISPAGIRTPRTVAVYRPAGHSATVVAGATRLLFRAGSAS